MQPSKKRELRNTQFGHVLAVALRPDKGYTNAATRAVRDKHHGYLLDFSRLARLTETDQEQLATLLGASEKPKTADAKDFAEVEAYLMLTTEMADKAFRTPDVILTLATDRALRAVDRCQYLLTQCEGDTAIAKWVLENAQMELPDMLTSGTVKTPLQDVFATTNQWTVAQVAIAEATKTLVLAGAQGI